MRTLALRMGIALAVTLTATLLAVGPASAAVIPVTTSTDEYNEGLGECSLREAVQSANSDSAVGGCSAGSGADEITLPDGSYVFTKTGMEIPGSLAAVGDLDVEGGTLTIVGTGNPTIDANALDRHFQVWTGTSLTVRGVTLTGGAATIGGAIFLLNGTTLSLTDVVIDQNAATSFAGGIWAPGASTVSIATSRITGNRVTSLEPNVQSYGGGLATGQSTLTVRDSLFSGNFAQDSGGAIDAGLMNALTLTNVTISQNSARDGDGLALYDSSGTLTNVTIADNGVAPNGRGGGLYADPDATDVIALEHVTFSNNTGGPQSGHGGSIYVEPLAQGEVTARNTIAAHPLAGGNCGGKLLSYANGHNLDFGPGVGNAPCFTQAEDATTVNGDPQFPRNSVGNIASPADNGGPTPTIALGPGSAALDAGVLVVGIATDQRGSPRPSGPAPDIGAYELFQPPPPPAPPPSGGGTGSPTVPSGCDIAGTAGADVITGTAKGERICGLGGNDVIRGLGGNDVLIGGAGNDVLIGGKGNDRLVGGAGNDRLVGGKGKDRFLGGAGKDFLAMKDGAKEFGDGGKGIDTASTNRGDTLKRVEKRR